MGGCVSDECKFKWIFLFCFVDIKKKVESVEPPSSKKKQQLKKLICFAGTP